MSCDIDENRGSNTNNDPKNGDIVRYTHEELVDLFKSFSRPPDQLIPFCEIISTNGPLRPVSCQPLSDLEKVSKHVFEKVQGF